MGCSTCGKSKKVVDGSGKVKASEGTTVQGGAGVTMKPRRKTTSPPTSPATHLTPSPSRGDGTGAPQGEGRTPHPRPLSTGEGRTPHPRPLSTGEGRNGRGEKEGMVESGDAGLYLELRGLDVKAVRLYNRVRKYDAEKGLLYLEINRKLREWIGRLRTEEPDSVVLADMKERIEGDYLEVFG
jgi:hypothetical protein